MRNEFSLNGINYYEDHFGVIKQHNPQPFLYDEKYCSTYDTPEYKKGSDILQALRIGFCLGVINTHFGSDSNYKMSITDVGYGNGAFLKFCQNHSFIFQEFYGHDVTGIDIPGVELIGDIRSIKSDIVTFWDCLEHFPEVDFLMSIDCKVLVVSLPYCHFRMKGIIWFDTWKHRKPNEHIRHFDNISLRKFMRYYGWDYLAQSYHEDIIRKGADSPNILTMAFKKT
jgi:hypothetical protein